MKAPSKENGTRLTRIVEGKRYDTDTATLLAGDDWWDGHNYERRGTNSFLYRTKNGRYFVVRRTQWQGQRDTLEPVDQDEAIRLFENELTEHYEAYTDAFPGVEIEEA